MSVTTKPVQLVKTLRPAHVASRLAVGSPVVPPLLHAAIPLAIVALWAVAIQSIRLREMSDLGLISVMPASVLVLLALLTVSFCLSLRDRPVRHWVAFVHVAALILMLYGVTAVIEPDPRLQSAYKHVGVIDYIIRSGTVDPTIDAYFNWPGFFALGAVISQVAGFESPLSMAAWASLVFNSIWLAPLLVIFRWATDDRRVWWLGLWVFYSANWIDQDYLAPQAIAFTLWLVMLAMLLTLFVPRPAVLAEAPSVRWLGRQLDPRRLRAGRTAADRPAAPPHAGGIVLVVVAIFAAVVAGHQLTPFVAVLTVSALVIFGGLKTRRLPIIMVVLLAAWISYQTTTFLEGHLVDLAQPVGSTSANVSETVVERVKGSSDHAFVVHVRVIGSVLVWLLALAGALRRLRARRLDIALMIVGAAPFVLPILQSYGGEMFLRVFLFALPAVAFFAASFAFPTPRSGRGWPTTASVALVLCVVLGLFQFMRYGNERLDHFTSGDVSAVEALYRSAPRGSVLTGSWNLPWKHRDYAEYKYRSMFDLREFRTSARPAPDALLADLATTAPPEGMYVIVTRSMRVEAELLIGKPGALEALAAHLRNVPAVDHLYAGAAGDVFRVPHTPLVALPSLRASRPAKVSTPSAGSTAGSSSATSTRPTRQRARRAPSVTPPRARRRAAPSVSPPRIGTRPVAPRVPPPPVAPRVPPPPVAPRVPPRSVAPRVPPPPPPPPQTAPRPQPSVTFDDSG